MNLPIISQPLRFLSTTAALALLGLADPARGALLTSWTQNSGVNGSGLNTASPVLGNGSADSGDNQQIYAVAPTYTLGAVGSSLTLSAGVTFTGLATPQADQFRFGLYNVNGQPAANGWLGYFASNSGASGGQTYSRLWERDSTNTTSFGSNGVGSATLVGTDMATPGNLAFASGSYTLSLTYTRVATGLEVGWTLEGTSLSYSVSGAYLDTTPLTYTFNRVGFFTGGGLNAGQVSFSNVDLSLVPEPASLSLMAGGLAFLASSARRRRRA